MADADFSITGLRVVQAGKSQMQDRSSFLSICMLLGLGWAFVTVGCADPPDAPDIGDFYERVRARDHAGALATFKEIPEADRGAAEYFEAAFIARVLCDPQTTEYFSKAESDFGEDVQFRVEYARQLCGQGSAGDCARQAELGLRLTNPRPKRQSPPTMIDRITLQEAYRNPALKIALAAHCDLGNAQRVDELRRLLRAEYPKEPSECSDVDAEIELPSCAASE